MILYIHPDAKMILPDIIPMSLPGLINRLEAPVSGRFYNEWTKAEVKKSDIIIMDIHWYTTIKSAIRLSFKLKAVNPEVVIIAGGLSASVFARQILKDSRIDYIIRGDGEIPLNMLVDKLLKSDDVSNVPNLVTRQFESSENYFLNNNDFDDSNFRDIGFFPSLQERIFKLHNSCHDWFYPVYPTLLVMRGCPFKCNNCYGSPDYQKTIFSRNWLLRSAEKVKDDLAYWSDSRDIHFLNVFHDFIAALPEDYADVVLDRGYDLNISWDFVDVPSREGLMRLMDSFNGGLIQFSLDRKHCTSIELHDLDTLIDRIQQVKSNRKYKCRLCYAHRFVQDHESYAKALRRVVKSTGCLLYRADFWWDEDLAPDVDGTCTDEQYRKCISGTNKFVMYNTIFKAGVAVHRRFPRVAESMAHMLNRRFVQAVT